MKLSDWVAENPTERRAALVKELGVTPAAVTGYCNDSFNPAPDKIAKIETLTDGAVMFRDFYPPMDQPAPANTGAAE